MLEKNLASPLDRKFPGEGNGNPLQYSGLDQWTEGPEGLQSMAHENKREGSNCELVIQEAGREG